MGSALDSRWTGLAWRQRFLRRTRLLRVKYRTRSIRRQETPLSTFARRDQSRTRSREYFERGSYWPPPLRFSRNEAPIGLPLNNVRGSLHTLCRLQRSRVPSPLPHTLQFRDQTGFL